MTCVEEFAYAQVENAERAKKEVTQLKAILHGNRGDSAFNSQTSLNQRQPSLTVTKSQIKSSSISSTENSSTMLKPNEKANNSAPTSSLVVNQGQVNQDNEEKTRIKFSW